MDKFFSNLVEEAKRQKEMISNTDYIEWLYNFTDAHPSFTSIQWDYQRPANIFDDDYEKVGLLTDFFVGIENYCDENMIAALGDVHDFAYIIKYKDKYLKIGVCIGQGAFNYVEQCEEALSECILFESIMNNIKDHNKDKKEKELDELKQVVRRLRILDTPLDVVMKTVKGIYD